MTLSNELWLRIYRDIVRQRALDNQLIKDAKSGKMPPGWHSGLGQDAIVAPVALLQKDDYVTYTHRGAYVCIANPSLGIFGRSGMQGGHFPLAVGMGITAQRKGKGQVVMMFFGDGCGTRGHLHEAFNFASVWKLPIIWMCENNGLSMSVDINKTWAVKPIAKIADNYAMPGKTVDGNDVIAVAEAADEFIERARRGEGPALLEMLTYRWRGHVEGDPMWGYRTREEVKEWQEKDPVPWFEKALLDKGLLRSEDMLMIKGEADEEVAEAQKFADESPDPDPEEIFTKLYATSHT